MLPKPWIIEHDDAALPVRPVKRLPKGMPTIDDTMEDEDVESLRGVEILKISPDNPNEIAI